MNNTDRLIRLVLAGIFTTLWFTHVITGVWGVILLVLAGIFVVTSIIGWCPLYTLFGISTRHQEKVVQR